MTVEECQRVAAHLYASARESTIADNAVTFQLIAARWSQLARDRMFGEEA
jgi:hypothetical protein